MNDDGVSRHVRRRSRWKRLFTMRSYTDIVGYELVSDRWQAEPLTILCLSDLHAMAPWTSLAALEETIAEANRIEAELICLLGDYVAANPCPGRAEAPEKIASVLARLEAPLGVHAVLGNHDWEDDPLSQQKHGQTSAISQALTTEGLQPMINTSRRVTHQGTDLWLVGMDSQRADSNGRKSTIEDGRHDANTAFSEVPDESLAILLAHEPDYFVFGDHRPVMQLSGHTHGGQANFFGWRPFTPSEYAGRYAYGHVIEDGKHLVVSGGVGYTHLPLRIAQPPEMTLVRVRGSDAEK